MTWRRSRRPPLAAIFGPVSLNCQAQFAISNTLREVQSHNVVARLEGSDPALKNETIVYTAHWDHLGRDPALSGDQIFNGAVDNASGVAIGAGDRPRVHSGSAGPQTIDPVPGRDRRGKGVARRQVLRGAPALSPGSHAGQHQYRRDQCCGGRPRTSSASAWDNSTLDDLLVELAQAHGRTVLPDAEPEKGYYFRSDHFEFAKQGVPALDPDGGRQYIGKPADFGQRKHDEYTAKDYHKVSDEVKPDWDLSGAVEDARLLVELGYRVAQGDKYPEWKPGSEFRARREAMLKAKKP